MKAIEAQQQFQRCLKELSYSRNHWAVFNDFLEYSLIMFKGFGLQKEDFAELEKIYPHSEQHKTMFEAFVALGDIADNDGEGFKDPFGDYFMEHFSNDRKGQFFTPEHVCDMMVQLMIPEKMEDGKKVLDPCCGSGRLLLSAAKINRNAVFYAQDIDEVCCKMTVINFILNTMVGEVQWTNSLTNTIWHTWHIRKMMLPDGHYVPYYQESGERELPALMKGTALQAESSNNHSKESHKKEAKCQKTKQTNEQQLNLFD